jgi:UDP-N-acetylmuramate dehydrogenase
MTNEIINQIIQNEPLAGLTTMKVGGSARYFVRVQSAVELVEVVQYALKKKWPYFVLGGGSNVIISDTGFDGLVIKNEATEVLVDAVHSIVQADSGARVGKVAAQSASAGLSGAEFYFGIPGTIGGAVYGNAGLRGHETADILKDAILLTERDGKAIVVKRSASWFEYTYRDSRLKRARLAGEQTPVLVSARLQLYPARSEVILSRTQEFLGHRKGGSMAGGGQHGWQPTGLACAGCIFQNPSTDPEMAAGRLLDQAGVKRLRKGGAAVAKEHANFIYNKRNATARDIYSLIEQARDRVRTKFDVDLELEVELIGQFTSHEAPPA